jgi:hypothetical protein
VQEIFGVFLWLLLTESCWVRCHPSHPNSYCDDTTAYFVLIVHLGIGHLFGHIRAWLSFLGSILAAFCSCDRSVPFFLVQSSDAAASQNLANGRYFYIISRHWRQSPAHRQGYCASSHNTAPIHDHRSLLGPSHALPSIPRGSPSSGSSQAGKPPRDWHLMAP